MGHHWSPDVYRPRANLFMEMSITLLINLVNCMNPAKLARRKLTEDPFSPARIPDLEKQPSGCGQAVSVVVTVALGRTDLGSCLGSVMY